MIRDAEQQAWKNMIMAYGEKRTPILMRLKAKL